MAVDNRPFKSKEQDGQGNEVIIRDQQLVEQGTATTMASGACFETRDVDDRPVKIPRDNMMNIVLECIGIILNDSSRNLGTNVQKALGLQGNTVGHSTVADFASVLGGVSNSITVARNGGTYTFPSVAHCVVMYSTANSNVFVILVGNTESNKVISLLNAPEWVDVGTDSGSKLAIVLTNDSKIKITQHLTFDITLKHKILW